MKKKSGVWSLKSEVGRKASCILTSGVWILNTCVLPVLFFIALFPLSLNSQTANDLLTQNSNLHRFGALTLFHGLPSDRVRAIAQSADGALWFGTDAGLARYDGRRTQTIRITNDATQPRINALYFDMEDGALWIGTEAGAARLLSAASDESNWNVGLIDETKGSAVTAIINPSPGRVFMTSAGGVLFECARHEDGKLSVSAFPSTPLVSANGDNPGALELTSALFENENESLLVGTQSRGVLRVTKETANDLASRPRPFFVYALERDGRGRVWLGAKAGKNESGLYDATDAMRLLKINEILSTVLTIKSNRDDLWVGTDARGVFHFRAPSETDLTSRANASALQLVEHFTFENTAGGLRSNHVDSIFVDGEGVVWFGTDKGVCRYDGRAPRVEVLSSTDAESNFVRTLYQTRNGQFTFCGTNRGLFVRDAASSGWRLVASLANASIYDIKEDARGHLLIGTLNGLYVAPRAEASGALNFVLSQETGDENTTADEDENDDIDSLKQGSVRAIVEYHGAIYIASFRRGLERVDMDDDASQPVNTLIFPNNAKDNLSREILSLHADADGKLWIGTARDGVFLLDGERFAGAPALDKLKGRAVWAIRGNSANDGLWFTTERGLFFYKHGAPQELIDISTNEDVRDVLPLKLGVDPRAWAATAGGGALRVAISSEFGAIVTRLDAEQGLPSQNVFALLSLQTKNRNDPNEPTRANSILLGTNRGVVTYTPARTPATLHPTRIIGKRSYAPEEWRDGLRLDYPQNSLLVETAAMSSRTFAEQFQYAFLLSDADGKIIARKLAHNAQFQMENLKPGAYRVIARAYNADLVASSPFEFTFEVARAPFPRTTVALASLLTLALIALWWGWMQNRKIRRTSAELSNANTELATARHNLANETEAERRRIARDLHDQTLADLRRLALMSDELATNGTTSNGIAANGDLAPAKFRSEIESISTEVRRICEDLSPSVLENIGLTAALEFALAEQIAHLPPEKRFEHEFVCEDGLEERLRFAPSVKIQIYRIVQEALNNICRHADAKHVRLTASIAPDEVFVIEIIDDGRGFDLSHFEPVLTATTRATRGRGLANMRARADLINARIRWKKGEPSGSEFVLKVPSSKFQIPS